MSVAVATQIFMSIKFSQQKTHRSGFSVVTNLTNYRSAKFVNSAEPVAELIPIVPFADCAAAKAVATLANAPVGYEATAIVVVVGT